MHRKTMRASVIAGAILATLPLTAFAARVDYNVDMGVEWNDNVALSTLDPIDQRYLRGGLGFTFTETNSVLQASVDGRIEYRNYEDDIFSDTVDGTLSGRVNWIIIPQRLFFLAENNLSVQPVDALVPDAPGNRQQVNVFSMGPTLLVNFSPSLQGQGELRYVNSDAEVTDEFNSQRVALALRTIKELSPTSRVSLNLLPIPGHPGYLATSDGTIIAPSGRALVSHTVGPYHRVTVTAGHGLAQFGGSHGPAAALLKGLQVSLGTLLRSRRTSLSDRAYRRHGNGCFCHNDADRALRGCENTLNCWHVPQTVTSPVNDF